MNKIKSVSLVSLLMVVLPLSVNATAPLEGEPDWEARKRSTTESETEQTERERLLQELKRMEEAEKAAQKQLEKDGF
ncbi:hypothetical protein [Shewanella halifaxensis]|uniref:hypothetical protein n=1 Tax=Shewanella halifaxensis TaxID=271098 RepID=UPI0002E990E4|nr:hypothetical protein [Shewanella halifaxensis]